MKWGWLLQLARRAIEKGYRSCFVQGRKRRIGNFEREKRKKGVTIFCGGGRRKEEGKLISLLSLLRFERKINFFL